MSRPDGLARLKAAPPNRVLKMGAPGGFRGGGARRIRGRAARAPRMRHFPEAGQRKGSFALFPGAVSVLVWRHQPVNQGLIADLIQA